MLCNIRERACVFFKRFLSKFGYSIVPSGLGYFDAAKIILSAEKAGLSIGEDLDSIETNKNKVGKTSRVANKISEVCSGYKINNILEIGTGTGIYLEKLITHLNPNLYEVYETSVDWRNYIENEYSKYKDMKLICHPADGESLEFTDSGSIDLVCAFGVFVYIDLRKIFKYLEESVRVCKKGSYIVFDCYMSESFSYEMVKRKISENHWFPTIFSDRAFQEFVDEKNLELICSFVEVDAIDCPVDFIVLRKK